MASAGFGKNADGNVTIDGRSVESIAKEVSSTPFFLYSKCKLTENYKKWESALSTLGIPFLIGYAVKANNNLPILRHLQELGSGAVLVSGWELRLAQMAGMQAEKTILNGNGKRSSEVEAAISAGCFVNIDSEFDFGHISAAAKKVGKKCRVLLRVNPAIDAKVHSYLATGNDTCKFGMRAELVHSFLDKIKADENLEIYGVHMHMGSTIKDVSVFRDSLIALLNVVDEFQNSGVNIRVVNIGGGLGIDYSHAEPCIGPQDLVDSVKELLHGRNITLIVEPGRSLIANTAALVTSVLGLKSNGKKNFVVVDGSMTEVIRPALYGAYHHIEAATPDLSAPQSSYDVVGPVCESGDFLGKDRTLHTPKEHDVLLVHDTGAYCRSMSSNYNMRPMPAEYWYDGENLALIRKADTFEDLVKGFEGL